MQIRDLPIGMCCRCNCHCALFRLRVDTPRNWCSICRYSIEICQTSYAVCLQYRYCSYSLSRWARIAYWTEDTRARRGRKKRCQTMERAILFFLFFSFSWRVASHLAQLKKAKANSPDDFTHMHVCHSRKVLVNLRAVAFTGLR